MLTTTRTGRSVAMTTLLLFGVQLGVPAAWAQAPSMPASGGPAKPAGAAAAPGAAPTRAATGAAAGASAAAERTASTSWPRVSTEDGRTFTVYQPQVEQWDGTRLHARAAVSVESGASPLQHFGVVWFSARAEVDKANRLVVLTDFLIDKVSFPSDPDRAADYRQVIERRLPRSAARVSLDRIQSALAITRAQVGTATPRPVKNDPPRVIVSTTPAILVLVDGKPVLRPIQGSSLVRVVNTWALIVVDAKAGQHYLRALGRWFEAATLEGPWRVATRVPPGLDAALQTMTRSQRVNLLDDPGPGVAAAAAQGALPTIYVSTVPTELVETQGRPDYEPIEGTDLLHVRNSSTSILVDTGDQHHYLLLSGRWFRGASLADGPWEYVAHDKLPAAFAKIPGSHPRGAVLASIAGTPQAQEALIDNSIPQTAEVSRTAASYRPSYEGAPKFQPIDGTTLHYAANAPDPVIQVDARSYYALKDGVWFMAPAPLGPWTVAPLVPAAIYTIPVASPLHYVTYVHVYASTPETVSVGYTPGYYGTVVAPSSVVVYGTGYVYPPVYLGTYWYPPPATYGFGAGFGWGAVTGFAFGAVAAGAWGGAWGCCGWHGDVDIDRTVNINRSDAYNRWNQSQVRSNLESRAQSLTPQQRQQVQQRAQSGAQRLTSEQRQRAQQAAQERGAAPRSNDVYAGRDGNTYRRGAEGWERNTGQGWSRTDFSQGRESASDLNRQQQARSVGAARESSYQRSGSGSSGGAVRAGGARTGGARAGGGRGGGGRRR